LVLLALIPAIALEELLFRSLLLGGLSPVLPQGLLLVGLAAYFGLLHLPQGALGIAGTALAGLGLGLLFIGRGSLLAPLIAHYVADVIQLILAARSRTELAALR
jgi:membrane protease YdiL (CAAX protease family)